MAVCEGLFVVVDGLFAVFEFLSDGVDFCSFVCHFFYLIETLLQFFFVSSCNFEYVEFE